jgi:basic membrane protein A and related proteins
VDRNIKLAWDYSMSFTDSTAGQNYGEKQVSKGADILFQIADAAGLGYFKAAQAHHKYGIGFAADQDYLGHYVLTSALVRVDMVVVRVIQTEVNGTFRPGSHIFDLKNAGLGYATDMNHVTAKIKKAAATAPSRIESGKVRVSPNCALPKSA